MTQLEMVRVRVVVNVDNLRIGYEDDVELTPRIEKLVQAGYLQILGHIWMAPAATGTVETVLLPTEPPAAPANTPAATGEPTPVPARRAARRKQEG